MLLLFALACNASKIYVNEQDLGDTQSRLCANLETFYASTQSLLIKIDYNRSDKDNAQVLAAIVNVKTNLCDDFRSQRKSLMDDAQRIQELICSNKLKLDERMQRIFDTVKYVFCHHYINVKTGVIKADGAANNAKNK